jgi:membrane protease YdiL (CAAX protease family)
MSALVSAPARADARILLGLAGLAGALAVRVAVAGSDGVRSVGAGLTFALLVAAVAALTRARLPGAPVPRAVLVGVAGAVVLCVPAAVRHTDGVMPVLPIDAGYLPWAIGVVAVAIAEEALLRGSLFTALEQRAGTVAAIAATSLAFALLHVPLYGWTVVPLDLGVGVWLGVLRASTGSVVAPALAHALADLAGWWLR